MSPVVHEPDDGPVFGGEHLPMCTVGELVAHLGLTHGSRADQDAGIRAWVAEAHDIDPLLADGINH